MSVDAVKSLWKAIQARDWDKVTSFYSEAAVMLWPVSGESFTGRAGIVAVNEKYPEGWSIHVLAVDALADGRVVSRVRVDLAPNAFFAISFFTLESGMIVRVEEYWATQEEPEPWRTADSIPGWGRIIL